MATSDEVNTISSERFYRGREGRFLMTTRQRLAWVPLLLCLTACRDNEAQGFQKREAEFRLKEACFSSGTKFFHEFAEKTGVEAMAIFYSPKRNSCICETRRPTLDGSFVTMQLHDCLSNELVSESRVTIGTFDSLRGRPISPGGDSYKRDVDAWQRTKDALR